MTMMKNSDISVAASLIIHGALRSNEERPDALAEALKAIRAECDDWAEALDMPAADPCAIEDHKLMNIDITAGQGAPVSRTPYNLETAMMALLAEAIDLNGPEAVEHLRSRISAAYPQ